MRQMKDSGVEWIGEIPEDWKISRVKFFYDCYDGKRVPIDSAQRQDGPYPYWGAGSITDHVSDYLFDEELVLVGEDGAPFFDITRPVSFLINEKVWINNHIHVLKAHHDVVPAYMVYFFNVVDYGSYINGSILNKLTQGNMGNIAFTVPPVCEQRRIADYLDRKCAAIDSIIEKQQKIIEKLKEYKLSIITEAVTKGLNPDVEMKDSGVEWIGQIPSHWKTIKIKQLGFYRNGLTYAPEDIVEEGSGTLVLRSSNIKEGRMFLGDSVYVNSTDQKALVKKNDILICSRNGSKALIGKNALIESDIKAYFGAFMMIYRCEDPEFIRYVLNSSIFNYYLGSFFTATINQLTGANFGNMIIPYCDDSRERFQIVKYLDIQVNQIDARIKKIVNINEKLQEYKKSLIYEVVTGKKEV